MCVGVCVGGMLIGVGVPHFHTGQAGGGDEEITIEPPEEEGGRRRKKEKEEGEGRRWRSRRKEGRIIKNEGKGQEKEVNDVKAKCLYV